MISITNLFKVFVIGLLIAFICFSVFKVSSGTIYDVFLDSQIGDPNTVEDIVNIYSTAKSGDTIIAHVSGPGGSVDTVFMIVNAIKTSKAHTIMIVEAPSYSGDAYIATQGNELFMKPYTYLMFHTSSALDIDCDSLIGLDRGVPLSEHCKVFKTTHLYEIDKLLDSISILTTAEKAYLKTGHDVYITSDEYANRLKGHTTSQVIASNSEASTIKEISINMSSLRIKTK